ncbi:MAG TPA: polysaccharide biosynthesis/export family protein [Pyrinomonadaceae bacterium]|nr:polysaccharide biosynthesis/export family protein [Pyrinomonadaceae bacterium]
MKRNMKLSVAILVVFIALAPVAVNARVGQDGPMVSPSKKQETSTPAPAAAAQEGKPKSEREDEGKAARPSAKTPSSKQAGERLEPDDASVAPSDVPQDILANRREQLSEEQAVVPYYNNFMTTYRLGPEDVISVEVFGQPRYSKQGITVPPNGRISYPLIKGGVMVVGKTTEQVAEEITAALDEYIIDPQVTVTLDKAQSAIYGVMGDVAQPGIRPMTRRLSVYEALMMAGGVLPTGDKKKVVVARQGADGIIRPTVIDVAAIEKGKAPNSYYLNPGDQVFVPGNRMKKVQAVLSLLPVVSFFRIFTGGF